MTSLSAAVAVTLAMMAPVPAPSAGAAIRIEPAQIFFLEELKLPAEETGRLVQLDVSAGDRITLDQLLGRVDERQHQLTRATAELERAAAAARASDEVDVLYAKASQQLAESELKRDLDINRRSPGTVPDSDIQHKRLAAHRAKLQVEKSQLDRRIAQLSAEAQSAAVMAAEDTIERCQLVSPLEGMVVEVLRHCNEWVSAGDPVLHIARMDRLRVDGLVDASQCDVHEVAGRPVTVEVTLARGRKVAFPGRVAHVSPQVQAGGKYRIRAEVENQLLENHWVLRPGLPATMTIHLR